MGITSRQSVVPENKGNRTATSKTVPLQRGGRVPSDGTGSESTKSSESALLRSVFCRSGRNRSYQRNGVGAQHAAHPLHKRLSEL